ncbi:MAG: DEAD/DEAH box helicase family protein [Terrimicrobiaceae bacterium]
MSDQPAQILRFENRRDVLPGVGLPPGLCHASPVADKIARFRSLFRGREDVHARRFENPRSGKSGYVPACGNEWARGVCEKPRIKCSDCPNPCWLGVTDEVVRWHLAGRDAGDRPFVMGLYPMLRDESCFLLAVDFDGEGWRDDVAVFGRMCRERGIPAAIERSRSGNGAHAWFFFEEAIPATLARKLGSHLLTETMEFRPDLGLASYDRLFPNQDTLPRGGFGNLIALPLQKAARDRGHSLFLDGELEPYADQWEFLGQVGKIPLRQVAMLVAEVERRDRVIGVRVAPDEEFALAPWQAPPSRRAKEPPISDPLPDAIEAVLADQVYLPKDVLPPALRNRIIRIAAFQNPEFYRAQAMRLPTFDKPRVIACAEDHPGHIALPRGCLDDLRSLFKTHKIRLDLEDARQAGIPLAAEFRGELRPDQQAAAEAMLAHDTGVLAATTAFGKTVVAAWLVARRSVNTLVLVHRQQLMEQWIERLSHFLGVPVKSIGRLGGGRRKLHGTLDVALLQSLARKGTVDNLVADYGHLVVDECHHLSAQSFELVARRAKARYVTGLSATVARKDGHHPMIFMQCGPVRHRVDAKAQAQARPFEHRVLVCPTSFRAGLEPDADPRIEFRQLCGALVLDESRNATICADVASCFREGRHPLVLTERTEHVEILADALARQGLPVIRLQGGMGRKALRMTLDALAKQEPENRILLATGRFVGEGFDDPQLDTLFLAMPVSWRGTIAQYVGRLHRLHGGKTEVRVYDYADLNVPMLSRMFDRRCEGYEAVGYSLLLPASAVPGWPPEVPLPVDPQWKRDYAASVRRLIRDGVDNELADLFVRTARAPAPGAEGAARARSASEAFLYKRLESLPETQGRFLLNARLPIPFDQHGHLEADFLCEEARLVVEIDGPQHLADEEAWRRDRRKDALLQQHGYFILRFLAGDAGRQLDGMLDSILAVLASRPPAFRAEG